MNLAHKLKKIGVPQTYRSAKRHLGLVQRRDYTHFGVMRAKLKWSGGLTDKK